MKQPPRTQVLLLPATRFFRGQEFSHAFARHARRMSSETLSAEGECAQLQRHFECIPRHWPMAAIYRQSEYADAEGQQWLLAEPIFLQPEMRGARVMAAGNFQLSMEEKQLILHALRSVFGDYGFELMISRNDFLYIRASKDNPTPTFTPAPDILGCDLATILPEEKVWMALFNECQIILHNHPMNVERQRNGKLPINALWFWGSGQLPVAIYHHFETIDSMSADIMALRTVALAHVRCEENILKDLRHVRDWPQAVQAFNPALPAIFDFSDGVRWHWLPKYRWYFWRRRLPVF